MEKEKLFFEDNIENLKMFYPPIPPFIVVIVKKGSKLFSVDIRERGAGTIKPYGPLLMGKEICELFASIEIDDEDALMKAVGGIAAEKIGLVEAWYLDGPVRGGGEFVTYLGVDVSSGEVFLMADTVFFKYNVESGNILVAYRETEVARKIEEEFEEKFGAIPPALPEEKFMKMTVEEILKHLRRKGIAWAYLKG